MLHLCWSLRKRNVYNTTRVISEKFRSWWGHPEKFRSGAHGMYATTSLYVHMIYVDMMLCRLFGKNIPTHLTVGWVSIMHKVVEGYTFNWDRMLSDKLAKEITEYKMDK